MEETRVSPGCLVTAALDFLQEERKKRHGRAFVNGVKNVPNYLIPRAEAARASFHS